MPFAAIYRSTDPAVLARVAAQYADRKAWADRVLAVAHDAGFPDSVQLWVSDSMFGERLRGFTLPDGEQAPKGWRTTQARPQYLPSTRSSAAAKALAQIGHDAPSISKALPDVGMPSIISHGSHLWGPAIGIRPTAAAPEQVWIGWACDPDAIALEVKARNERARVEIPDERWRRVPLSEFWALVEAGNPPLPLGGRD